MKATDEEQRGHNEKDQGYCENKEIDSKGDSQKKNEEIHCSEELPKKEEVPIKEDSAKKEKKLEQEEKERSIREERERDKRILKEIEERERERQVREKQRMAEEKEKERLKEEKEKEILKEEIEKERLKGEKEKERLKEEREEKEREEERKAIVARAKKEAKEQRKTWAEEKSIMSAKGSVDLEDELKVKEDQYLQKEIEDAIQNEDTGFVDMKTTDSFHTPSQACQIPTAFQSGKEPGQTSKEVDSSQGGKGAEDANEGVDEHIYEDIDDLRTRTSQMKLRQLEDASKDETGSDESLSKPKSGKKSRAPLPPGISSSLSSSLSSSPGVSSFAGSNSNLVQPDERIRHLTPVRMFEEEEKKEEDGQVFYRSPGYPAPPRSRSITQISASAPTLPEQPIREKVTPFTRTEVEDEERFVRRRREEVPTSPSPTRIFTSSGGITRLRTYSPPPVDESSSSLTPSSPGLLPRSETLPRCPHCTIHAWLPHSPGCPNKSK